MARITPVHLNYCVVFHFTNILQFTCEFLYQLTFRLSPIRHDYQQCYDERFFLKLFIYLFIYLFILWLCWVFVSVQGLSLVAASGEHSSSRCVGLSLLLPLLLRSAGSVIVAHGPSCSAACGIFPDQGSNPCPLRWQADSQPLRHQGSPMMNVFEHTTLHTCGRVSLGTN